jgi:hypothetical protein
MYCAYNNVCISYLSALVCNKDLITQVTVTGALIDHVRVVCKTSTTCKAQYCVCDRHNYYYTVLCHQISYWSM